MASKKEFSSRPFEKLRKAMERTSSAAPTLPDRQKKEEYTDEVLFNNEMEDVRVIEEFRRLSIQQRRRKEERASSRMPAQLEPLAVLNEIAAGRHPINLPDTQEYVEWVNSDYEDGIIAKLHEGRFAVQAFLDLHGFTVADAEEEMDAFFRDAFLKSLTCVKIIHGRGLRSLKGPRIKDAVLRRLLGHYRKEIIAYVSARQCDGGLGALYILLRRK